MQKNSVRVALVSFKLWFSLNSLQYILVHTQSTEHAILLDWKREDLRHYLMVLAWTNASLLLVYTDKQLVGIDGWMVLLWLVEKGEHNRILYDVLPPDQHIIQITNQYTFMDIQRVYLHSEKLLMMGVWGKLSYSYVPKRTNKMAQLSLYFHIFRDAFWFF